MATLALTVSYNGSPFCGFARQPGMQTVQGSLEEALALLFRREVPTTCAGRTDTGVHALGQVVSFDVSESELRGRTLESLQRSLNALTHEAVGVRSIVRAADGFSARFDAKAREYRYFICTDACAPLVMADFCWHLPGNLDLQAMRDGAAHLVGEHDFKSFCLAASAVGKPTCREVISLTLEPCQVMGQQLLCIPVVGSSFLHSMVRTIVGTLVAVGRGRRDSSWVAEVLDACDRSAAGENAPASGLVFWRVTY